MKILLNLLPPEKKSETRKRLRFRVIVAQGTLIILLGIFYWGILLGISGMLSFQLTLTKELSFEGGPTDASGKMEIESYEKTFQDENKRVAEVSRVLNQHVSWERFFEAIDAATPPGVLYTKMATGSDLSFSASGTAPNREALLALESSMNGSPCFSGASVPLSDKLAKENIDFQLSATIRKSCLVASGEENKQ